MIWRQLFPVSGRDINFHFKISMSSLDVPSIRNKENHPKVKHESQACIKKKRYFIHQFVFKCSLVLALNAKWKWELGVVESLLRSCIKRQTCKLCDMKTNMKWRVKLQKLWRLLATRDEKNATQYCFNTKHDWIRSTVTFYYGKSKVLLQTFCSTCFVGI